MSHRNVTAVAEIDTRESWRNCRDHAGSWNTATTRQPLLPAQIMPPTGLPDDHNWRTLAGVPDKVMFATKPQLADDRLQHARVRGIRAGFITDGEVYGGLDLRKSIRQRGTGYVLAVRSNYTATLQARGVKTGIVSSVRAS